MTIVGFQLFWDNWWSSLYCVTDAWQPEPPNFSNNELNARTRLVRYLDEWIAPSPLLRIFSISLRRSLPYILLWYPGIRWFNSALCNPRSPYVQFSRILCVCIWSFFQEFLYFCNIVRLEWSGGSKRTGAKRNTIPVLKYQTSEQLPSDY